MLGTFKTDGASERVIVGSLETGGAKIGAPDGGYAGGGGDARHGGDGRRGGHVRDARADASADAKVRTAGGGVSVSLPVGAVRRVNRN